jgi:alpha/beta superfamily hydrolase
MNAARSVALATLLILTPLSVPARQGSVRSVTFPSSDGGTVEADLYGSGTQGVVLAHGAVFDKSSWANLAQKLSSKGLVVLAINFRGYGKSLPGSNPHGLDLDVLAAIHYLKQSGVKSVSVVGASMGGSAVGRAATECLEGEIDRLALLSPVSINHPERMKAGSFLFVASQEECLMPRVKEEYEAIQGPKKLEVLPGNAHAQHIFSSDKGAKLTDLLIDFLTKPAH